MNRITLRQATRTGIWTLERPANAGEVHRQVFQPNVELRDIAAQTEPPIGPGYWLRDSPEIVERDGRTVQVATRWTWVQL
jgi:hypothetical protein